jgi:3-deoxy-7-phosphoheptulonate synthase
MSNYKFQNVNIAGFDLLPSPTDLCESLPATTQVLETVHKAREEIKKILHQNSPKLLIVIGPCSIHDTKAALEYAEKLQKLNAELKDKLIITMRVYFEKPRTTVGWKGLINDPDLDDSFHIEKGLHLARQLLLDINEMGLACATEALDPITPQYISDLIAWSAIGARTTESQTHREMASGLSMPVGFKNGTDGSIDVAINALQSASQPHHFLGIEPTGKIAKFSTKGNPDAHVVLRGGADGPNYEANSLKPCTKALQENELCSKVMVDCSHANSNKDHNKQPDVLKDCLDQIQKGEKNIMGFMIESHLHEGNQKLTTKEDLEYGVSITDKCVDWETTEKMLHQIYEAR